MLIRYKEIIKIGSHEIILETGKIAKRALSSVTISSKDTVILITIVNNSKLINKKFFFPLTINYIEKSYSVGKIPGGFFKREGKPSEREIIISRLIDRSIRPLFPKHFYNEIQIIIHVLSVNPIIDPDILSAIGTSAAISISGMPINSLNSTIKIGYIKNKYIINPNIEELKKSKLNLILSSTKKKILMIENISKEVSEEIILNAINYGFKENIKIINILNRFKKKINKRLLKWKPIKKNFFLNSKIKNYIKLKLKNIFSNKNINKKKAINNIKNNIFLNFNKNKKKIFIKKINNYCNNIILKIKKKQILKGNFRIDNRGIMNIRNINIKIGVLPRTHGSVVFTKNETQALVTTTLGSSKDEQKIETLSGEYSDRFIVHYNMPPFATGETKRLNYPKRREIGHGYLTKKALINLLPKINKFNYSIRLVSEIIGSNGSSSMASICGSSLSLMKAGVPIKNHVAGIAMGLVKRENKIIILSDILGQEDKLGFMDLKIAGTIKGITVLQMDVKNSGIDKNTLYIALIQAKNNRIKILKNMENSFSIKKIKLSKLAPYLIKFKINPKKIKNIIGKGGSIIKNIIQKTKTNININDKGFITIISLNKKTGQKAKKKIKMLTKTIKIGEFYKGTVTKLLEFGAIVQIMPGKDGLLHINQVLNNRKKSINDFFKIGQIIKIKVINYDNRGRLKFSMKNNNI